MTDMEESHYLAYFLGVYDGLEGDLNKEWFEKGLVIFNNQKGGNSEDGS